MQPENGSHTYCAYCQKQLHGRKGKLFCDVDCKNNYNSQIRAAIRAEENKYFPAAIQKIKTNHRVLREHYKHKILEGKDFHVKKSEIGNYGFDHCYCINAYKEYDNKLWKGCFGFYWYEKGDWLTITYDPNFLA